MRARPFGDPAKSAVLVIGHDPRLQRSNTIAPYALFADYYFRPESERAQPAERAKYGLAKALYECMGALTPAARNPEAVMVTNLCNTALPHAPPRRTVLIPRSEAQRGLTEIRELLVGSNVRTIFPMSAQVNYWLQELGFYGPEPSFVRGASPEPKAASSPHPYYRPRRTGAFKRICGRSFRADGRYDVFPILHVKQWPLKGRFIESYSEAYATIVRSCASVA